MGHSVLCQKGGVGHVFFIHYISKCSGSPLPPILFDQSLNAVIIFSTAVPFRPVIENKEKEISFHNSLIWSSPDSNCCPVTMYTVHYKAIKSSQTEENAWYRINASAGTNDLSVLPLECDTEYEIKVSAWNERGESKRSESWQVKYLTGIYIIFTYLFFF